MGSGNRKWGTCKNCLPDHPGLALFRREWDYDSEVYVWECVNCHQRVPVGKPKARNPWTPSQIRAINRLVKYSGVGYSQKRLDAGQDDYCSTVKVEAYESGTLYVSISYSFIIRTFNVGRGGKVTDLDRI